MTTTRTNLALVENQIHIFSQDKQTMLFSTDDFYNKIGVEKLDRKHFVKPFDMKGMQDAYIHENNYYNYDDRERDIIKSAFEDGYNAKEAEFTREEMEMFWVYAKSDNYTFDEAINKLRPLSIPASVTLNENNEVIAVQW